MQKSTLIAIILFLAVFAFGFASAQTEDFVVIKNGNTLVTYEVHVSSSTEQAYEVVTNTYTGTDVATLKGLNVPEESWSLFANNQYLIFSSEAFQTHKENTGLQEQLSNAHKKSNDFEDSRDLYRVFFWFLLVVAGITIVLLSISLATAKKEAREARAKR